MSEKERFIKTLKREKVEGKVPTFELVFFLTMESLGRIHPVHCNFYQWDQMSIKEQDLLLAYQAQTYVDIAKKYDHSAIFVQPSVHDFNSVKRLLMKVREISNDQYYICMHGDPTYAIPNGDNMMEFSARLYEEPELIIKEQEANLFHMTEFAEKINKNDKLLDGFTMCSDYCFNVNPFYTPTMFGELVAPVLEKQIKNYHDMGYYVIKHTDGNIMPIIDQIIQCKPDALHSLDPQGGVDLAFVSKKYGDKVSLCGNVNCAMLQTGTEEDVRKEVYRCLTDGMSRGKGFIFCTSNCVYSGMELSRYELMIDIWKNYGKY